MKGSLKNGFQAALMLRRTVDAGRAKDETFAKPKQVGHGCPMFLVAAYLVAYLNRSVFVGHPCPTCNTPQGFCQGFRIAKGSLKTLVSRFQAAFYRDDRRGGFIIRSARRDPHRALPCPIPPLGQYSSAV